MISRYALAGLISAGLSLPASALTEASGAGGREVGGGRVRSQIGRAAAGVVPVLPPARPDAQPASAVPSSPEPVSAPAAPVPARVITASINVLPPLRPSRPAGTARSSAAEEPPLVEGGPVTEVAAVEAAPPTGPAPSLFGRLFGSPAASPPFSSAPSGGSGSGRADLDRLIAHHARLNGVPEALVHRIVVRESRYNPRAVGRGGAMGLMQIKTGTARALGYDGGPAGLLDAETNLIYAVKYLAGAYRVAGGNHDRAVGHYARGYYYEARRQGLTRVAEPGESWRREPVAAPREAAPVRATFAQPAFRPDENR